MEQDLSGKLVDKIVQDKEDYCYLFAKKMTELMPIIERKYECFQQLKRLFKAVGLARYIVEKGILVDLDIVK